MKMIYGAFFVQLSFQTRFFFAVGIYLSGFVSVYLGFLLRWLACIYLGASLLGVATTVAVVSMMGLLKAFPDRDYVVFCSFTVIGSTLLSVLFVACEYFEVQVYNVSPTRA